MTDHPLTDEKCMSLFSFKRLMDESRPITVEDSMRAAYDLGRENGREERLIEVLYWLRATRYYGRVAELADQLEKAMCPTQQEGNNAG